VAIENQRLQQKKNCVHSLQEIDDETRTKKAISSDEGSLIKRLKEGDETAFSQLVEQYHTLLLHLARRYVRSHCSAEEIVQETWMGVFQGLPFFKGRSSLKTWIVRILTNCAYTWAQRDQRFVPFSSLMEGKEESDTFTVEPESLPGGWISLREDRHELPEECLLSIETNACIAEALQTLSTSQRAVMVLCDIEGWRPEEICSMLGLSTVNQRVLLHRARSKVRQGLAKYLDEE